MKKKRKRKILMDSKENKRNNIYRLLELRI